MTEEKQLSHQDNYQRIPDLNHNQLNNTGGLSINNHLAASKQYNFVQQLPNLSTNSSLGLTDPSVHSHGVPSLMHTQKKTKTTNASGSGKKKKQRKRTVTKKQQFAVGLGTTPYALIGSHANKFATPKDTTCLNTYQPIAFTVQQSSTTNDYGTNSNKLFQVNNENSQSQVESSKTQVVPRSSSNNRIQ